MRFRGTRSLVGSVQRVNELSCIGTLYSLKKSEFSGWSVVPSANTTKTSRAVSIAAVWSSWWSCIVESTLISTKNPSISRNTFFVTSSCSIIRWISTNTLQLPRHLTLCPHAIRPFEILHCAPHQLGQHIPGEVFWTLWLFLFFGRSDTCCCCWCLWRQVESAAERREKGLEHLLCVDNDSLAIMVVV